MRIHSPKFIALFLLTLIGTAPNVAYARRAAIYGVEVFPPLASIADRIGVWVRTVFNEYGSISEDSANCSIVQNEIYLDLYYTETDSGNILDQYEGEEFAIGELDTGEFTVFTKMYVIQFGGDEYALMDSDTVTFSVTLMGIMRGWIDSVMVQPELPTMSDSILLGVELIFYNSGYSEDSIICQVAGRSIALDLYYYEPEVLLGAPQLISNEYMIGLLGTDDFSVSVRLHVLVYGNVEYTLMDTATFNFSVSDPDLHLAPDWNLISYNFNPDEHNVPALFADLADSLVILKNGLGQFYFPSLNFNNIQRWEPLEGYAVKMAGEGVLRILGTPIPPETVIPLRQGWNLVAYLPDDTLAAADGFRNIEDVLFIAKDGEGRFYWPARGYDDLILRPGGGYLVYVTEAVDFVWNIP
jgi:hypothetical protein